MFKTKQAKAQNAAAIPMGIPRPPVQPQTVHNHAPSEAGKTFSKLVAGLVVFFVGWQFLVNLAGEMGYRKPVATLGWVLVWVAGLLFFTYIINHILLVIKDTIIQVTEIKEAARVETARLSTIQAAQPRPGESRLTREDSKFAALLRIVMSEAYQHLNDVGQYTHNEAKPWSRRANTGKNIPGFEEPATEVMASKVSTWLLEKGVIDKNGKIDDSDGGYPSMAHFLALLEGEYYTPILVQKALPPTVDRSGYEYAN